MDRSLIDVISKQLDNVKANLKSILPEHLQDDFSREAYISGGCIYSLYNGNKPKDYDFFLETKEFAEKLQNFFIETYLTTEGKNEFLSGKLKVFYHKGLKVVMTRNAISIDKKYQIITKFVGKPKDVVEQFDFKHNMFYHQNDSIDTLSDWDFLDSNCLAYNEKRARDISGTIIRVHKFCERGMTITNAEMAKMLKKLSEVGFTEREKEIIECVGSY